MISLSRLNRSTVNLDQDNVSDDVARYMVYKFGPSAVLGLKDSRLSGLRRGSVEDVLGRGWRQGEKRAGLQRYELRQHPHGGNYQAILRDEVAGSWELRNCYPGDQGTVVETVRLEKDGACWAHRLIVE